MAGIDGYVVFCSEFQGADDATSALDISTAQAAKTITFVGNAKLDTSIYKFGVSSLECDGTGDRCTLADSADWDFGTGDWTIELWGYWDSVGASVTLFDTGSAAGVRLAVYDTGGIPGFHIYVVGTEYYTSHAFTPSAGQWYHFAGVRSGNNLYHWIDGAQNGDTEDVTGKDITGLTAGASIGAAVNGAACIDGRTASVRISKGIARYTATFTPPGMWSVDTNTASFFTVMF